MFDFREIWSEELAKEGHPAAAGATATGRAAVAAMQRAYQHGIEEGRRPHCQHTGRTHHTGGWHCPYCGERGPADPKVAFSPTGPNTCCM